MRSGGLPRAEPPGAAKRPARPPEPTGQTAPGAEGVGGAGRCLGLVLRAWCFVLFVMVLLFCLFLLGGPGCLLTDASGLVSRQVRAFVRSGRLVGWLAGWLGWLVDWLAG